MESKENSLPRAKGGRNGAFLFNGQFQAGVAKNAGDGGTNANVLKATG